VPDECEPDCDGDGTPDSKEIADGTSDDAYGNDIPDECEADCDGDLVPDFSQIQADMTLDVDRDAVLDSCQACAPGSGTDHEVLDGAHGAWVGSGLSSAPLRRFFASTGVLTEISTGQSLSEVQDVVVTPAGHALASIGVENRVLEFDRDGTFLGELISPATGQLDFPTGMVLTESGSVLVASRDSNEVLAYNSLTGAPEGRFVLPGAGGLTSPFGITFGPNGNLFVSSGDDSVLEFDGTTGDFVRLFVNPAINGGLDQPRGMVFKPDGNLLVASFGTDEVLEFEGAFGAPLGKWAQVGTATRLTQVSPWGIRIGPNGNVFVVRTGEEFGSGADEHDDHADDHDHDELDDIVYSKHAYRELHLTNAQMYEFDVRNGNFLRAHIGGNDHGLLFPTGFDFIPGWDVDCNLNQVPDGCDIDSGVSLDAGLDGVPDECQIDCNGSGKQDRLDIIPFGPSLDCNFNLVPDECEPGLTCIFCAGDGECDDGLSCTVGQCDSLWGICLVDLAPDSCIIDDSCHAALALNPGNDCEACDPGQPNAWSPAPPLDVSGLLLMKGAGTELTWIDHGSPVVYDVAIGSLGSLRADGGVTAAVCGAEDLSDPSWQDPNPDPAPGQGIYYLVRSEKSCGPGSFGSSSSGDERIFAVACL
jgi:DNA-binding beta-propeller fold protein YncE